MNVRVRVKNQMIGVFTKEIICGILVRAIVTVIKHVKLMNIQILKVVYAKKRLISKLVLQFEDEMLNTAESHTDDKKVT